MKYIISTNYGMTEKGSEKSNNRSPYGSKPSWDLEIRHALAYIKSGREV
jgi:hypothetical protein